MQYFLIFILTCAMVQYVVAPPVNQKKKDGEHTNENEVEDMDEMGDIMEYRRYLMEVIGVLETDPEFRAKLENANQSDIHTGKIADQLQFVSHNVRSRLDEIKRTELERLRHLATKENELKNGLDVDHLKIAEHLDHTNTRSFEIQDLKKLIAKTTKDLAEADRKRREEFKQHEMEVKFEEQEQLKRKNMSDAERHKYEQEQLELKEKHKKHKPIHHPGSKQQLEEVWEAQDHMNPDDFNPKTFFYMHDIDGNGVWDQDEVKALFFKELDKIYVQGASGEELVKRAEEMERMREHVFHEADLNKDSLISYEEFLEQTKKPDFQRDEGWQGLDEEQIFTQEEYQAFERHKQEEIQKMVAQGMMLPQHQGGIPVQHEMHPQQQFQEHPQYHQQQPMGVPQQQYPNHVPVQLNHGQMPQQYHPQLSGQQQFQGQAHLNQQYQPMPPQQLHGSIPVQQPQGQIPIQPQGQIPVQPQGQIPVQPQGQLPVHSQGQLPVQPQGVNQQQNPVHQVPQSVPGNAASQQHNQLNSQPAQAAVQQEINRNNIQTGGKA
ncbi:nucleobindin 1 isoform X3 [Nomia melanderi]|uniref:nucleobindin 1 isoform X3 n=1 Tax=Nomia melanderi TaxID=2448451 RepID=UPI003FCC7D40